MKRVIKFRVFDKKYNEYCEEPDFRYSLSRNGKLYNSENDEWHEIGVRFIVEFFTGLKDKNGVEIYEGDIMEFHTETKEIIFSEGAFGYVYEDEFISLHETYMPTIEIIGNIHQNTL